ncbi:MAG TPA: PTS sugar transporter subunit IIA [Thermoanaerobaculia bacterium]|nr:PTS sugar transporter subunit IIA [Thermoanaerobaculia bacterium]
MTIKQLAEHLRVNDRTVSKLVSEGTLPGVKIGNQWRFRKAMIDTWLDDQMLGITPRYPGHQESNGSPSRMLELASCFQADHVVPELEAGTKNTVIEEMADVAARLGLVRDKTWFVGALIERENVMPGARGGVAFLRALRRNPEQVVRPFMLLGRSRKGIDFDALDGMPTHLFFVLGLKFEELDLPWLQKLSRMFAAPDAVKAVVDAPDADAIFGAVAEEERRLGPEIGGPRE